VISSEYTINEYVHNVPGQNLKTKSTYIMHIVRILNQYTTIIKNLVSPLYLHTSLTRNCVQLQMLFCSQIL